MTDNIDIRKKDLLEEDPQQLINMTCLSDHVFATGSRQTAQNAQKPANSGYLVLPDVEITERAEASRLQCVVANDLRYCPVSRHKIKENIDFESSIVALLETVPQSQRAELKQNLKAFVNKRISQLGTEEIRATIVQVERLLSDHGPDDLPVGERILLAQQTLKLAANPSFVRQGRFNTCEVATIERMLWQKEPSAVAHIIADAAVTRSIRDYDGNALPLSAEPFKKDLESPADSPQPADRLYASQLFQVSVIEREWASRDFPALGLPKGAIKYKLQTPEGPDDSGERLKLSDGPDVLVDPEDDDFPIVDPGIDFGTMGKIYNSLSRKRASDAPLLLAPREAARLVPNNDTKLALLTDTDTKQLSRTLQELKENQKLPIIAAVTEHSRSGSVDLHAVTIEDYDPFRGLVYVINQRHPALDGWMSLTAVQESMERVKGLTPWQLEKPSKVVVRRRD